MVVGRFRCCVHIIVPDNREEVYQLLSRNGWLDDIGKLPIIGAFVAEVLEESPSQRFGFQEGDVIIKINGRRGMDALKLVETTPIRELS